jgi:transcriptional regulator with XRE-family HTH domain
MTKSEICKTIRKEARITCRELAQVLGVSVGDVSDIEHGRVEVSAEKILAMCTLCACKMNFHASIETEPIKRKINRYLGELIAIVGRERDESF